MLAGYVQMSSFISIFSSIPQHLLLKWEANWKRNPKLTFSGNYSIVQNKIFTRKSWMTVWKNNLFSLIVAEVMNSVGSILNLDVAAFKSLSEITVETSEKFDTYMAGRYISITYIFKDNVDVISNKSIN